MQKFEPYRVVKKLKFEIYNDSEMKVQTIGWLGNESSNHRGLRKESSNLTVVKGSVSRDFRPPVFFMIRTHLGP